MHIYTYIVWYCVRVSEYVANAKSITSCSYSIKNTTYPKNLAEIAETE